MTLRPLSRSSGRAVNPAVTAAAMAPIIALGISLE